MEGGGPTQVRRGRRGAREVRKELPIDSALKECRAGRASLDTVSAVNCPAEQERMPRSGLFHRHGFVLTSAWGCDNWRMTDGAGSAASRSPRGVLLWPQVTPAFFCTLCQSSFLCFKSAFTAKWAVVILPFRNSANYAFSALKIPVFAFKITNWCHAGGRKPSARVCVQLLQLENNNKKNKTSVCLHRTAINEKLII